MNLDPEDAPRIGRFYIDPEYAKKYLRTMLLETLESPELLSYRLMFLESLYECICYSPKFERVMQYVMCMEVDIATLKPGERYVGVPEYVVRITRGENGVDDQFVVEKVE